MCMRFVTTRYPRLSEIFLVLQLSVRILTLTAIRGERGYDRQAASANGNLLAAHAAASIHNRVVTYSSHAGVPLLLVSAGYGEISGQTPARCDTCYATAYGNWENMGV